MKCTFQETEVHTHQNVKSGYTFIKSLRAISRNKGGKARTPHSGNGTESPLIATPLPIVTTTKSAGIMEQDVAGKVIWNIPTMLSVVNFF